MGPTMGWTRGRASSAEAALCAGRGQVRVFRSTHRHGCSTGRRLPEEPAVAFGRRIERALVSDARVRQPRSGPRTWSPRAPLDPRPHRRRRPRVRPKQKESRNKACRWRRRRGRNLHWHRPVLPCRRRYLGPGASAPSMPTTTDCAPVTTGVKLIHPTPAPAGPTRRRGWAGRRRRAWATRRGSGHARGAVGRGRSPDR